MSNLFVCLEGADATGKTTVARCLTSLMNATYYKSPTGPFAECYLLLEDKVDPLTRYFFFRAATQHDSRQVAELLETSPVVCDRFIDTTFVDHVILDPRVRDAHKPVGLIIPNLVVVLTADESVRRSRLAKRTKQTSLERDEAFQRKVDSLYCTLGYPTYDTSKTTPQQAAEEIFECFVKTSQK